MSLYFDIALISLIASGLFDIFCELINIFAIYYKKLKKLRNSLKFTRIISLLIIVFIHWVRLSHKGKVCSGYFIVNKDEYNDDAYLIHRGMLLMGLIYCVWALVGVFIIAVIGYTIFKQIENKNDFQRA